MPDLSLYLQPRLMNLSTYASHCSRIRSISSNIKPFTTLKNKKFFERSLGIDYDRIATISIDQLNHQYISWRGYRHQQWEGDISFFRLGNLNSGSLRLALIQRTLNFIYLKQIIRSITELAPGIDMSRTRLYWNRIDHILIGARRTMTGEIISYKNCLLLTIDDYNYLSNFNQRTLDDYENFICSTIPANSTIPRIILHHPELRFPFSVQQDESIPSSTQNSRRLTSTITHWINGNFSRKYLTEGGDTYEKHTKTKHAFMFYMNRKYDGFSDEIKQNLWDLVDSN